MTSAAVWADAPDGTPATTRSASQRYAERRVVIRMSMASERELEPQHATPERWLVRERPLLGIRQRFLDRVELNLDPAIEIPVHAKREDLVAVAKDLVRARARRRH